MPSAVLPKLFWTTFVTIFIAELGDKTQLATLAFSSQATSNRSRFIVFTGAALALCATSAIGVLAGGVLGRLLPPGLLEKGAGVLFVVLGLWMLFSRGG